jgi:hypothetical protein
VLCVYGGVVAGNISARLYPLYNFDDNLRMRDKYTKYTVLTGESVGNVVEFSRAS